MSEDQSNAREKRLIEELSQREKSLESKHKAELNALKDEAKTRIGCFKRAL